MYNSSARLVWDLLERGRSGGDLAVEFARSFGIPEELARKDTQAILHHWRSEGLIRSGDKPEPAAGCREAKIVTDWTRAPEPTWAAALTCTIRGMAFDLAVEPAGCVAWLQSCFQHLETPGAPPALRLHLRSAGSEIALVVNGTERTRSDDPGLVLGAVSQTILEHIYPGVEWLAMIHGGAIARNGAGIALPAASGSGKSTLIASLLPRGYDYLADDLIALAAPEGRIAPWPLPLRLKEGSWDVISRSYPDFLSLPQYCTSRGQVRQIVPVADVWDTDPAPLKSIVFPRYIPDANSKLTRLTLFEAIERLLSDRIWLGYPMTESHVGAFLAWLEDVPVYALVYGDAIEAAPLVEDIA